MGGGGEIELLHRAQSQRFLRAVLQHSWLVHFDNCTPSADGIWAVENSFSSPPPVVHVARVFLYKAARAYSSFTEHNFLTT